MAVGLRSDGTREVVLASRNETKILTSVDDGLTWQVATGAGVDQAFATRVAWYPDGNQSEFLIATDRGVFRYLAEQGVIVEASDGIPVDERDLVDLEVPRGGQPGPAVCVNDEGGVFMLDPLTYTWSKVLDAQADDRNAVVAIAPDYDPAAASGPRKSLAVGINGVLYLSQDGGQNWNPHINFATPAQDETDWHVTAVAYADDYSSSGELLVGRGRETAANVSGDAGELWRSSDFGSSFVQRSVMGATTLHSSVQELVSTPMGPSGDLLWLLTFHFFPEAAYQPESTGILRSLDGGKTWSDDGNTQDFLQEFAQNERTAVGREYRGMITIVADPEYSANGELWVARSEGVWFSQDEGVHWDRRQLRPSKQVRGVGVGYNAQGELFAYAATYGSANVLVNVSRWEAEWLPGSGMAFQLPAVVSPRSYADGVMASGGQVDLVVRLQAPAAAQLQGFWSVNELFSQTVGETGYVRTLELHPNFSAAGGGTLNPTMIWSARQKSSTRGINMMTLDGLNSVELLDEVEGYPGEPPAWMKSLSIAPTFDPANLTPTLDVFGGAYLLEQVWQLKNAGTLAQPDFEWALLPWTPPARVQAIHVDPRFQRPNAALLWVITTEGLYRLQDMSTDWSQIQVVEYPKFDYLPLALELPPDMGQRPMIYVMTWGGGLIKLDLTQPGADWKQVGVDFPDEWGNCFAFAPDFANNRVIIAGGQNGLLFGRDIPGAPWRRLPMDYALDNMNPGIGYYDPNEPMNPAPERRWRWNFIKESDLPPGAPIDFFGDNALWTESDGAYHEFPLHGGSFAVRAVAGPGQGEILLEAFDYHTGALVKSVQQNLGVGRYRMVEVPLDLANGSRDLRIRVTAVLDAGETYYFDGLRFQEE